MACYQPITVNVARKKALPGTPEYASRSHPVLVPCGHCLGCRADQARQWAVRIMHESQTRPPAYFATLTYAPENLPENGSLVPDHTRDAFKRLRRRVGRRVSYYLCGEYGETTNRPHYHAVLFGAGLLDRTLIDTRHGAPVWKSELLEDTWRHGLTEITPLTYGAAAYVAGYVRKKVRKQDHPEYYDRVDPLTGEIVQVEQEFARMSRRPALGREWIERYWTDVYPRDFVVVNGFPMKPPRYYDKYMELPDQKGGSEERREVFELVKLKRLENLEEVADDKLIMKRKVHEAKTKLFKSRGKV